VYAAVDEKRGTAVKLTDALLGEHGIFYSLFDQIEALAKSEGSAAQIQCTTMVLNVVLMQHANLEEELLFPALERVIGSDGPLAVMRADHVEIEQLLEQIEDARNVEDGAFLVTEALSLARSHFQKEEQVLFGMALQLLDDETLNQLGDAWAKARGVTFA
jgi:hemerythrin-like domain-containing protein